MKNGKFFAHLRKFCVFASVCALFFAAGYGMGVKKSVETLYLGVRCGDMPHLLVTYVTEKGKRLDPYCMKNTPLDDEGCCLPRRLTPNVRMVQTFGMEIDSRSAMEVDGVTIKIKTQGVVR